MRTLALSLLTLALPASAQTPAAPPALDSLFGAAHERGVFNGTALVARGGAIIYETSFGHAEGSKREREAVTPLHRFGIGSISKEFSAVGVALLAEEGQLALDDPISDHVSSLPDWADRVRVRHLLSYTSGLPQIRVHEKTTDDSLFADLQALSDLPFEPGTGYLYSNHNVILRYRLIEALSGRPFPSFVRERLFGPCRMEDALVDPPRGTPAVAVAFDNEGTEDDGLPPIQGFAFLTARDLYRWSACLHSGQLLKPASVLELAQGYHGGQSALGNVDVEEGEIVTHWHHGSMYNHEAGLYVRPADGLTVAIVTNNKNFQVGALADAVAHIVDGMPYTVPKRSLYLDLRTLMSRQGFDAGLAFYQQARRERSELYDFSDEEAEINDTGYYLMREGLVPEAVRLLGINAATFPESWNVHDSYGEALALSGRQEEAIAAYERSVTLNPENTNGVKALARLRAAEPRAPRPASSVSADRAAVLETIRAFYVGDHTGSLEHKRASMHPQGAYRYVDRDGTYRESPFRFEETEGDTLYTEELLSVDIYENVALARLRLDNQRRDEAEYKLMTLHKTGDGWRITTIAWGWGVTL